MAKFASDYYILRGDDIKGPTTADRLRELAANGKLRKTDGIRRGEEGGWTAAGEIDGLFEGHVDGELLKDPFVRIAEGAVNVVGKAGTAIGGAMKGLIAKRPYKAANLPEVQRDTTPAPIRTQTVVVPSPPPAPPVPIVVPDRSMVVETPQKAESDRCPFCCETIMAGAKKCRHCGEILDVVLRAAQQSSAGQPSINITNTNTATVVGVAPRTARWSPLMAMFLSFLIPGLGQLYKGQAINAFVWFVLVVAGYAFLIVPGVVLHLLCVCGAGMGDPYR